MKKLISLMVAMLMLTSIFTGCSQTGEIPEITEKENAKVMVNISGVVETIDVNRIKLDNGKWVIINENTIFKDDPDNEVEAVNNQFAVGNLIAGYTEGNPEDDEVTAYAIYKNEPMKINAKVAVNIEGEIVKVDGNRIKLDNGIWVIINENTIFEDDPDNGVEAVNNQFAVGNLIAGYTEGNPEADEVIAYQIYYNQ